MWDQEQCPPHEGEAHEYGFRRNAPRGTPGLCRPLNTLRSSVSRSCTTRTHARGHSHRHADRRRARAAAQAAGGRETRVSGSSGCMAPSFQSTRWRRHSRKSECRRICSVNSCGDATWQAQLQGSLPGDSKGASARTGAQRLDSVPTPRGGTAECNGHTGDVPPSRDHADG